MLGYTEAELTTMTLGQITAPGDEETDVELARQVFADGGVYRQEKRFVHKSGRVVQVAVTVSVVRGSQGTSGSSG